MVHRIQNVKPRMRKAGNSVDATGQKPALSFDTSSDIIMFKEESWVAIVLSWLKTSIMFALSAALIMAILYVILAGTLLFFTSVSGNLALVARGTFLGGNPSTGEIVLASNDVPASTDPLSKMKDGILGVPNSIVVEVLSNPNEIITKTSDGISVENGGTFSGNVKFPEGSDNPLQLNKQIAVQCVAGSCTVGDIMVLDTNLIYGEVRNPEEFTNGQ